MAGGAIAHGVHALLWAIDQALASEIVSGGIASLSVRFHKPIRLDRTVRLHLMTNEGGPGIRLGISENAVLLFDAVVTPGAPGPGDPVAAPSDAEPTEPENPPFASLAERAGSLALRLDAAAAGKHFPAAFAALGPTWFAGLLACTQLVGMKIPGLNSLFASLAMTFDAGAPRDGSALSYRVERARMPFVPIALKVQGPGLSGAIEAFLRPEPAAQPSLEAIAAKVVPGEFRGRTALIVGGSRGLGETVAKLMACGGGHPVITWNQGEAEAAAVATEIRGAGFSCDVVRMDVLHPGAALSELKRRRLTVDQLYYFATPHIAAGGSLYDPKRLALFETYYVTAFRALVTALAARGPLAVFYPSTVFIDEMPRDMADYVAAKAAGEATCRHLEKHVAGVSVLAPRLPKLPTDQTQSIIKAASADPADILLTFLRQMAGPGA